MKDLKIQYIQDLSIQKGLFFDRDFISKNFEQIVNAPGELSAAEIKELIQLLADKLYFSFAEFCTTIEEIRIRRVHRKYSAELLNRMKYEAIEHLRKLPLINKESFHTDLLNHPFIRLGLDLEQDEIGSMSKSIQDAPDILNAYILDLDHSLEMIKNTPAIQTAVKPKISQQVKYSQENYNDIQRILDPVLKSMLNDAETYKIYRSLCNTLYYNKEPEDLKLTLDESIYPKELLNYAFHLMYKRKTGVFKKEGAYLTLAKFIKHTFKETYSEIEIPSIGKYISGDYGEKRWKKKGSTLKEFYDDLASIHIVNSHLSSK